LLLLLLLLLLFVVVTVVGVEVKAIQTIPLTSV
jgi:hypothetical protein